MAVFLYHGKPFIREVTFQSIKTTKINLIIFIKHMNMKIKSKISKVSTQSLGTLCLRIIDTVNNSGVEEVKSSKNFLRLLEVNNLYQDAVNPINIKMLTAKIDEKFIQRDTLFAELYTYVKGLTVSDQAEERAAANVIMEEITKFGLNFRRLRNADKSLRYIRIIESLKKPEYADAIEKTGLTDRLNLLDSVQNDYETMYMNKGNRIAGKNAASSLRKEVEDTLKKFLDELDYLSDKNGTDAWTALYANVKKRVAEMSLPIRDKQVLPNPNVEKLINSAS